MKTLSLFLLVLVLMGCGKEEGKPIQLHIYLPEAYSTSPEREELLSHIDSMELEIEGKSGGHYKGKFEPGTWNKIQFPSIEGFPKDGTDELSFYVRIWDLTPEGVRRSYPFLSGKTILQAKDVAGEGMTEVTLRLHTNISPDEG